MTTRRRQFEFNLSSINHHCILPVQPLLKNHTVTALLGYSPFITLCHFREGPSIINALYGEPTLKAPVTDSPPFMKWHALKIGGHESFLSSFSILLYNNILSRVHIHLWGAQYTARSLGPQGMLLLNHFPELGGIWYISVWAMSGICDQQHL